MINYFSNVFCGSKCFCTFINYYFDKYTGEKRILTNKDFTTLEDGTPSYADYVGTIFADTNTGYGWPDMGNRWCTSLKKDTISKYLKEKRKYESIVEWHGIAADELTRLEKNNDGRNIRYLLAELNITEKEALQYCYDLGFDWGELYKRYKRVSCYCCPLKSKSELMDLYTNYPGLWEDMRFMDSQSWRKFTPSRSLKEVEKWLDGDLCQLKFAI